MAEEAFKVKVTPRGRAAPSDDPPATNEPGERQPVTDPDLLKQLEGGARQPVTDQRLLKALDNVPEDNTAQIVSRQAGALGRKAVAHTASVLKQMDPDVDYSGVTSPGLRAEYGFLDTQEERDAFLKKNFGANNVTKDSFGRDVILINGQKVAFLPRGNKDEGKPGAAAASYGDAASEVLPVGGMTVGAIVGAPITLGPIPVGSIAGAGFGASGGRGLNKIIKQIFLENSQSRGEIARDIAMEFPKGVGAQVLGEVGGLVGRSILRGPFREGSIFGPITEKSKEVFRAGQADVVEARELGLKPKVGTYSPNASFTQRVQNAGFRLFGDDLTLKNRPILTREAGKLTGGPLANTPAEKETLSRAISARTDALVKVATEAADASQKTAEDLLKATESAISEARGPVPANLGSSVASDVRLAKQAFSIKASELYAPVDAMAGTPVVPTQGLKDTMQKILTEGPQTAQGQPVFASDTIKKFASDIQALPDHITFQQMQVARSTLRDRAAMEDLNVGLSEGQAARLAKAADTSFDQAAAGPFAGSAEAVKALRRADQFYSAGIKRFNDLTIEAMVKDATTSGFVEPEKVAERLAQPGMVEKLERVKKVVNPKTFAEIGAARWQSLLNDAKSPLTGNVSGKRLATSLKKMGPVLDSLYGKHEAARMASYAEHLAALDGEISAESLKAGDLSKAVQDAVMKKETLNETMKRGYVKALQTNGPQSLDAAQWLTEPDNRLMLRQTLDAFGPQSQESKNLREYLARRIFSSMEVEATRGAEKYGTTELMGEPLQKELNRYGRPYLEEVFGKQWTDSAFKFARQAEVATRKNPVDSGGLLAATIGLHWLRHFGDIAKYFTAGELLSTDPVITYLSTGIEFGGADFLQKWIGRGMQLGINIEAEEIPKKAADQTRGYMTHGRNALQGRAMGGPVQPGQPYVVGETGPEIVVPTQPGTVIPSGMTGMRGLLAQVDPMGMAAKNRYKEATGASIDASETPGIERTSQGVTQIPPNVEGLAKLLLSTHRAQTIEQARQMAGGMVGKIDTSRPIIKNPDGSFSIERTITIESGGKHYLIPTIVRGRQLSEDAAIEAWKNGTNQAVGVFNSNEEAEAAAVARSREIGDLRGREAGVR